jgi:hypothetical protein
MTKNSLRTARLTFALSFFAIVSLINFTHTEKGPAEDVRCPACQLQQSALGSVIAAFVFLPLLVVLLCLRDSRLPDYEIPFIPRLSSRSPPSA